MQITCEIVVNLLNALSNYEKQMKRTRTGLEKAEFRLTGGVRESGAIDLSLRLRMIGSLVS